MKIAISAQGLVALQEGFKNAPDYTRQELVIAMVKATQLLEREVKDAFPTASGLTRASITSDAFSTPTGVLGVVGSASVAAAVVELGSKPHMPPVAPIVQWVTDKLGLSGKEGLSAAYAIAKNIAKHGTKAKKPFEKTARQQAQSVAGIFEQACGRIAARLAGDANSPGAGA